MCEYGDGQLEHLAFFRHRYSYDVASLALLLLLRLEPLEMAAVRLDVLQCLAYRAANLVVVVAAREGVAALQMLLFHVLGLLQGVRFRRLRDPRLAMLALKASNTKGYALEKHLAVPAWQPVLSLESVDGALWERLKRGLLEMMPLLPPAAKLEADATALARGLAASGRVVDADAVTRFSLQVFLLYLFDAPWQPEHEVLVAASWEWRREIAVGAAGRCRCCATIGSS